MPGWTHPEIRRAVALRAQGLRAPAIRQALAAEGYPLRSVVAVRQAVARIAGTRPHPPWTPAESRIARSMRDDGQTFPVIAAALAAAGYPVRSPAAVRHHLGYVPES